MSFIIPIVEYGDIIWGKCSERDADLLQDVQINAARIITGIRINSSRTILYYELRWDSFIHLFIHSFIHSFFISSEWRFILKNIK